MNRRELLRSIALLTGATVVGGEFLLSGCKNPAAGSLQLSPAMINLLNEVAETILPATDTPGAKAAAVGDFMKVMVKLNCYYFFTVTTLITELLRVKKHRVSQRIAIFSL